MLKSTFTLLLGAIFLLAFRTVSMDPPASSEHPSTLSIEDSGKNLIMEMVEAIGGVNGLKAQKDVEYTYTYFDTKQNLKDISTERYLFSNEASWAEYRHHKKLVMPDAEGIIVQGYDGQKSWITVNGQALTDGKAIKMADFFRKTNFYWFAMMFKLLDPGLHYQQKPDRQVDGKTYKIVEVGFNENIGDAQDTYVLYINPKTKLVDQFLFTVMDFGRAEPLLMKVKYSKVNDLQLPAFRKYAPCDWEGNVAEDANWVEEISENIKFNNGFTHDDFQMK